MPLISSLVTPLNESMCQVADLLRQLPVKEKTVEKLYVVNGVAAMHKVFEDSDISRFPEVQEASKGTLLAAYHVMVLQDVKPTEQNLLKVLRAFLLYAMDESEMASAQESDQVFMDLVDKRKFPAGVLDRIVTEVSNQAIHDFRERGYHVIRVRETRGWDTNDCGFYVFTDAAV